MFASFPRKISAHASLPAPALLPLVIAALFFLVYVYTIEFSEFIHADEAIRIILVRQANIPYVAQVDHWLLGAVGELFNRDVVMYRYMFLFVQLFSSLVLSVGICSIVSRWPGVATSPLPIAIVTMCASIGALMLADRIHLFPSYHILGSAPACAGFGLVLLATTRKTTTSRAVLLGLAGFCTSLSLFGRLSSGLALCATLSVVGSYYRLRFDPRGPWTRALVAEMAWVAAFLVVVLSSFAVLLQLFGDWPAFIDRIRFVSDNLDASSYWMMQWSESKKYLYGIAFAKHAPLNLLIVVLGILALSSRRHGERAAVMLPFVMLLSAAGLFAYVAISGTNAPTQPILFLTFGTTALIYRASRDTGREIHLFFFFSLMGLAIASQAGSSGGPLLGIQFALGLPYALFGLLFCLALSWPGGLRRTCVLLFVLAIMATSLLELTQIRWPFLIDKLHPDQRRYAEIEGTPFLKGLRVGLAERRYAADLRALVDTATRDGGHFRVETFPGLLSVENLLISGTTQATLTLVTPVVYLKLDGDPINLKRDCVPNAPIAAGERVMLLLTALPDDKAAACLREGGIPYPDGLTEVGQVNGLFPNSPPARLLVEPAGGHR